MKKIQIVLVIAFAALSGGFSDKGTWIIHSESQLTIEGSTNINTFVCKTRYWTGTDTLRYIENKNGQEMRFTRSRMTIPIRNFNCGSRPISSDFRKTVKSETYPVMEINFISLENLYCKNDSDIKGVVDITLAGVTTTYTVCYQVYLKDNGTILLRGTHLVNFSDFQLEAPDKLNGLIKVKDVLKVEFNLVLKEV